MKKSQAEIYGITLFFVILFFAIVFFSVWKSTHPDNTLRDLKILKYQKLADSSLMSILKMSTGCYVEREKDSLEDLIRYCLVKGYTGTDPEINCEDGQHLACDWSIKLLNKSLFNFYNSSDFLYLPFLLKINIPQFSNSLLNNIQLDNFRYYYVGKDSTGNKIYLNETNFIYHGYEKVGGKPVVLPSSQGAVEITLSIFYK